VNADILAIARDKINLNDVVSGHSTTLSPDVNTQVMLKNLALQQAGAGLIETQNAIQDAQAAVASAQNAADDAKTSADDTQNAIDEAKAAVAVAQNSVNTAQTNLTQIQTQSPVITAPFDGFISVVNVTQGQQIYNGQVAVQLADPTQFEVDVLVSERDIFNVSIGQTATVSMDALPGTVLPARVSKISQTATIQSGVVNYVVAVQITSMQPIASTRRTAPSSTPTSATPVQLKAGLTATASIIVTQRTNVLLVPALAVITQSTGQFVQVLKNGVTTQVQVQIGASDFQNAEVISGLSAGDVVVIPQTTGGTGGPGGPGGPSFFRLGG
jgi:RND family efflux transporter MFP subunit